MNFFDNHSHSHFSNLRILDSINKPKALIDRAIELGLSGIALTDHESLSGWMEVNQYAKELRETNPNFTIALGDEIYLTETRESGQTYYHFILIAKDEIGAKSLRRLSSKAWLNSYTDRGMERVPLLKEELAEEIKANPGHIIATTACIGSELGQNILKLEQAEKEANEEESFNRRKAIYDYIMFCRDLFGDDFYLECAPAESADQIRVNKRILRIAKNFDLRMCIGSDAHYLKKEDRYVHKAYLNSKGGEREVDSFYEYTYLMSPDEAREHLRKSFDDETIDWIFEGSNLIKDKIQYYSLERPQIIPKVAVLDYPSFDFKDEDKYPTLRELFHSTNIQERYWVNECWNALGKKNLKNERYISQLETEARVIKKIGSILNDCLFCYFNTFKHYIDLFWECGSIVGPGRGSATGFLSDYLLGITQLDPIAWELKWWRFLNEERAELPSLVMILGSCKKRVLTIA